MIDDIKRKEIKDGINLHMVKSPKFKTVLFGVYIKRPLRESEVSMNALLSRMIDKFTSSHRTQKEMSQALDYLYGAVLVSDVHKYGEKQVIQLKLQIPMEQYVNDTGLTGQALELMNEILNAPLIKGEGFDPELFRFEQDNLIEEVEMRKDDKDSWALSLCIEKMCEEEPYSIHEYGTVEAIQSITPESLYAHYQDIIRNSEMDVVVIGDIDFDIIEKQILSTIDFKDGHRSHIPREEVILFPDQIKSIEEAHEVNQGKLVLGYRMNVPYESDKYLAAFLGTIILGYGGSSKLFRVVRERESLCYNVFARADKFKSIVLIYAGVDFEKFDLATKLVKEQVQAIQTGEISDSELEIAKKNLISNYLSVSDYQNSYINFYYNQYLTNGTVDVDRYIEKINAITKEDVINAVADFRLDTVIRIKGEA